ncbi:hypothetical protein KHQ84_gp033 [Rhodococcus phage Finch]|uniref:Uncharacterized protein n=1 Tax=Rhodococcus phage Finch TaxID=2094144 RepID=A0A2P1JXD2_9CAUD|nr:hypothetical protein KHQ84_gp033 [Rhodococcus phage Finch]AVO24974.1 hypothetical protein SEA_FINCH_33 [Rhodococcus phage Finch]
MSLSSQVNALATRVGAEVKAVKTLVTAKYTKPSTGIPITDLKDDVQMILMGSLTSVPPATDIEFGGVKLLDGAPLPVGDPMYGYTLVQGPAESPTVPIVGQLVQVFSQWVSQLFVDDGQGYWTVRRSGLDADTLTSLGKADTASQPGHTHVIPWQSEIVLASPSTARANGYVEGVGGVSVDKPITLRSVFVRVPDWATMIGGTGNLNVQIYSGTTSAEGTLLATVVMASGTNNILYNLPSAANIARDGILRAKLVVNSTTGNGLQVQFRGDYQ